MLWLLLACSKDIPIQESDSAPTLNCAAPSLSMAQALDVNEFAPTQPSGGGSLGLALADLDGDGDLDLAVASMETDSPIYENDGHGNFSLVSQFARGTGLAVGDMDGDGQLELVLARAFEPNLVVYLDGRAPTEFGGAESEDFSVSLADVDGDGDLDAYTAAYNTQLQPPDLQGGEGTGNALFENKDGALLPADPALPSDLADDVGFMGQWLDADADGDLDLYTINDYGPFTGRNRLLLNQGEWLFQDATECSCDLAMYAMGAAVGDPSGDGLPELYLSNLGGPILLSATGDGRFVDITAATGASVANTPERLAGWGTAFVDLNGDSFDEAAMVFGTLVPGGSGSEVTELEPEFQDGAAQRDLILQGSPDGFAQVSAGFDDTRAARNLLVGDLDGDGDPDLVTAGLWYIQTWENQADCAHIVVDLPPNAIGAKVEITSELGTSTRWVAPASVWSSSSSQIFSGSLGMALVTVTWPDGTQWQQNDVAPGTRLDPTW
jgi:hypothetical protein